MITILRLILAAPGAIIVVVVGGTRQGAFTIIGNVITIVICIFVDITAIDLNIKPSTCSHGDLRAAGGRYSGPGDFPAQDKRSDICASS